MDKITISSTQLKNRITDVLNDVYFKGKTVVINRYGKPMVKIIRIAESSDEKEGKTKDPFLEAAGSWKDIDADKMIKAIYKARRDGSRKKKFLGNWE